MDNKKPRRGLGSLLGAFDISEDKELVTPEEKKGAVEIDISLIDTNKGQPRKNFDPTALQELADSIKIHGVIQPIVVVKKGDRYMIVAGERRFRASKLAGLKKMPAVIKDYTDKEIKEIALLENIQRQDLNPIETSRAMDELLKSYNWTQEVLAERLGKSRSAVANALRLLSLTPEVISMVEDGKLSAGHARSLVIVTDPEVQLRLAKLATEKRLTVRDMEKAVADLNKVKAPKKVEKSKTIEMVEVERIMQKKLATKVKIAGTEKKGKIVIEYYSKDDLERIVLALSK